MSKEKQIEEMRSIIETDCEFVCDKCEFNGKERCVTRYHSNALYNAGYRKQSEWISVEDRLPEEDGRYLAFIKLSHQAFENLTVMAVLDYGKSHGFYLIDEEKELATHWTPLPEPPKMKGGAE